MFFFIASHIHGSYVLDTLPLDKKIVTTKLASHMVLHLVPAKKYLGTNRNSSFFLFFPFSSFSSFKHEHFLQEKFLGKGKEFLKKERNSFSSSFSSYFEGKEAKGK